MKYTILLFLTLGLSFCKEKESPEPLKPYFKAPELPRNLDWFNTNKKLTGKDLSGKVILFHFWTHSDIQSKKIFQTLRSLEEKWKDRLLIISVHSGKYPRERSRESVLSYILKMNIEHPVIQDPYFVLWRTFGVSTWSSFVLIDHKGQIIARQPFGNSTIALDEVIGKLSDLAESMNQMNLSPNMQWIDPEKYKHFDSILSYPGKIASNVRGTELFVSDSGHNRILRIDRKTGHVLDIIGSGEIGNIDGSLKDARFQNPQGLAVNDKELFISDPENHSIRKFDFLSKTVATYAGTGQPAEEFGKTGLVGVSPLNYPWDIKLSDQSLYSSFLGLQQILRTNILTGKIELILGKNREKNSEIKIDSIPELIAPRGIAVKNNDLYIIDSERNSLFHLNLNEPEKFTLILGNEKMEYGDRDGSQKIARLQYPGSLAISENFVYIADTLNHKIKSYDIKRKIVKTIAGNGSPGKRDGGPGLSSLNEPGGMVVIDSSLYIADTNNHSIRELNLKDETLKTYKIQFDENLISHSKHKIKNIEETSFQKSLHISPELKFFRLNLDPPEGYVWDKENPFYFKVNSSNIDVINFPNEGIKRLENFTSSIDLHYRNLKNGNSEVNFECIVHLCKKNSSSVCYLKRFNLTTFIKISENGKDNPEMFYRVTGPGKI
ncbi:MAG: hypothetical protein H7A24_05310 [Leptospiraceae bacterium]|nr:hypothetical protein [Leptospiraceae bacterium]MCP5511276.1 hypothetical protein [Leptospiraceae bacterium]